MVVFIIRNKEAITQIIRWIQNKMLALIKIYNLRNYMALTMTSSQLQKKFFFLYINPFYKIIIKAFTGKLIKKLESF